MTGAPAGGAAVTAEFVVYGVASVTDAAVAPDGSTIAYIVTSADPETRVPRGELRSCALDGSAARTLVPGDARCGTPRWSPDSSKLAFTLLVDGSTAIRVLSGGGDDDVRELTRHAGAVGGLEWSPDGTRLAYTANEPTDTAGERAPGAAPPVRVTRRLDHSADDRGFVGDARSHVHVVDAASGERRRISIDVVDHQFPRWSPDGRWLAARATADEGRAWVLMLFAASGDEIRRIGPASGEVTLWSWAPGGESIIFVADPDHSAQPDIFVHEIGPRETRRLTSELASVPATAGPAFAAPSHPVWLDGSRVLFHSLKRGASGLEILDTATATLSTLERWESRNGGLSVTADLRHVVQVRTSLSSTGDVFVYDLRERQGRTVTAHGAALAGRAPLEWERFAVARGEFEIDAWLLKPPGLDPAKRYPLVLDVHGGPQISYGPGFMPHQQYLAANGVIVLFANPRGSTSYGRRFAEAVMGDCGGEDYQDLLAVLDAALERPFVDRDRIGIYGYSYGGYMAAWAIGHTERFRAAVCGAPVFNMVSKFGTSDIGFTQDRQFGGPLPDALDRYLERSPLLYTHRARTPTLIVQGEADERCPLGQALEMFVSLKNAGCDVELVRYPGASHLFFVNGHPEHRVDFLARVLAHFQTHLSDAA